MKIVKRFFKATERSFFLFGPRGTGKSTWLKQHYPKALVFDLLNASRFHELSAYPERFKEMVLAQRSKIIIIDEVQKLPILLDSVHELIELKQGWQFILTGSSSRKLKRQGVDLLGGRAQLKHMHPFLASELKQSFSLESFLETGMLPLVLGSNEPADDLKAYIALYMREEVVMEGLIRKVEPFNRFLEIITFSQGQALNCSNIARDCRVSSRTIENYVQILEDLLLSFKVPVFEKKAKRLLRQQPKFYYFDVGVFKALRPMGPLDDPYHILGPALETLVAQHLRAWLAYSEQEGELFYWRTRSGLEVDFILYGAIGFYALEVKNTGNLNLSDFRGLKEFKKDYPQARTLMLYRGKDKRNHQGIECWPVEHFLKVLTPNNFPV